MRAVLCGYYGKGNAGDEALLASLLQMLPEYVQPLVLSGNPRQTRDRYGVESCDRSSARSVIKALRSADAFIWGGGSLIQDTTSAASPFYYSGIMGLASQIGLKTIAWAQGIGPLHRPLSRWIARQAFSVCHTVSVRDRASAEWLAGWQIPCTIAPDPAFALTSKPVAGLLEVPAPRVAVTLRSHPQLTRERLQCLTQALIEFQTASQTSILLVPFQLSQDLAIAQEIQAQLPGVSQLICLEDPREFRGLFAEVTMAIGMRLHSLILAAAAGCRCFALSYDPKVSQLMAQLTLPGWELAEIPAQASKISQAWLECYSNTPSLNREQILALIDQALIHRDILTTTLSECKK